MAALGVMWIALAALWIGFPDYFVRQVKGPFTASSDVEVRPRERTLMIAAGVVLAGVGAALLVSGI